MSQQPPIAKSFARSPELRTSKLCHYANDTTDGAELHCMHKHDRIRRAGELRAQGLSLKVIASRLGVSEGQASKLAKAAAQSI